MLNKVLDKIKEIIGIEQFDDTKILIDTDWLELQTVIEIKFRGNTIVGEVNQVYHDYCKPVGRQCPRGNGLL